jgi:tetratricopeptide (TPR) repeat protein
LNEPSIDPKVAVLLLRVLRKELSADEAGQDVLARFEKEPAAFSQALTDYLRVRLQEDKRFEEKLAESRGIPPAMRAIIYGGKVERLVQIAEAGTVVINPGFPFWMGISLLVVAVVAVGSLALVLIPKPLPPMAGRFNVAVAQFVLLDDRGHYQVTAGSREFSNWLFQSIKAQVEQLDPALNADARGPDQIGPITGKDLTAQAKRVAHRHNANMLIYGVIIQDSVTGYQVVPEFYVSDQDFIYGSEVAGSERLGKPISLGKSLDQSASFELNKKLNIRTRVLKFLIRGMVYLLSGDYARAELDFETATTDPAWEADEGKEVGYLLLGAARLLAYDPLTNPGVLSEAESAFKMAHDIKPSYARSYVGLGEVALLQATLDNSDQAAQIKAAADFYQQAQTATEQTGYLSEKSEYGLGRANLLGVDLGLPDWSAERAKQAFESVIRAYGNGQEPLLAWQAAHSHCYLGRLAALERSWQEMASQCWEAVDILSKLPGNSPRIWVARYWEYIGFAEAKQGHHDQAVNAYRQSIQIGSQATASPTEMSRWQSTLESLEKGTP